MALLTITGSNVQAIAARTTEAILLLTTSSVNTLAPAAREVASCPRQRGHPSPRDGWL